MIPTTIATSPQPVAPDTWLIPTLASHGPDAFVGVHSLVIRGSEPVLVDTGCSAVRDAWAAQAFSVVEPDDVRWIFLSHDDHDHIGNLNYAIDLCSNATVVACSTLYARLTGSDVDVPLDRMRWVDAGGSFDAGDRTLNVVRPPMFDSPTTRGLHDPTTGVLWAVDAFCALFPAEVYEATDIPADLYDVSFTQMNTWNTPWLEWVDPNRYRAVVEQSRSLAPTVAVSAHGPILRGDQLNDAFHRTLAFAGQRIAPTPGQEVLDQLLGAIVAA